MDIRELYQETILDHNRNPRHFGKLTGEIVSKEAFNPLCGDHFHLHVKLDGEKIDDISFEGSGCAISTASTSVLTTLVKGKTKDEALKLFRRFHTLVSANAPQDVLKDLGSLEIFSHVRDFPMRVKCATLSWHALKEILEADGKEKGLPAEKNLQERVISGLKEVYDPEIPVNIYDLGLIYAVEVNEKNEVSIIMTLTSPNCPVAESLPREVEQKISSILGVTDARVEITFEPPWSKEKMSEEAKLELGLI